MFSFHPIIQQNYTDIHTWLSKRDDLPNYRQNSAWSRVTKQLTDTTFESVALQFYVLFPAHAAKVAFVLENLIGHNSLAERVKHNSHITVIDVGCGAGAASVAFLDSILKLKELDQIQQELNIHFVGIDPNVYAIAVYYQQLIHFTSKVQKYGLNITHKLIHASDLRSVTELREELGKQRKHWEVPFLSHVFLFQANVVSPFSERYGETASNRSTLAELGIPMQELSDSQQTFGKEEATAYKQIFKNTFIDNLHVITVGTDGYEQRVSELATAIDLEFSGNSHIVEKASGGEFFLTYAIPKDCYWQEYKGNREWPITFCAEVSSISNVALADEDWNEVQSIKNLQTAWARARHHLLAQTLVDEVEVRLFESKLDVHLRELQQQLISYAQDVVHTDDRLHFKFPKSDVKLRPLGLSRIEEEILSTALIQKLGQRISGITSRSYAYKFSRTYGEYSNEYLYENWFDAYGKYIDDARFAARKHTGCIVIQTDIRSFYTRIIRDSLVQLSTDQLSRSARIEWLLKILFARDIDEHEAGKGIVQGNIASGFFANLYLIDLDTRFGPGNEWEVEFFRYVDDMIIVVPEPDNVDAVLTELMHELEKIGLELNRDKTVRFNNVQEFIGATDKDEVLDNLQSQFQEWQNCLWILDPQQRQIFRKAYNDSQAEWWYRIEVYMACLQAVGINIEATLLSRRIYKYLFNERLCEKDFTWQEPFYVPPLPDSNDLGQIGSWQVGLEKNNAAWISKKAEICDILQALLAESREQLTVAINEGNARDEKQWIRNVRFCVNKLVQIGWQGTNIGQVILEMLLGSPWLLRNPHTLIENLAVYGHDTHIQSLLVHYNDETDQMQEYMKSIVLRAIGFLPSISHAMWEQVVNCAVSTSNVTSLMATETWLRIVHDRPEFVEETHLDKIISALTRIPKPIPRLRKNYFLILGKHNREIIFDENDNRDSLMRNVEDIIHANDIDSLFDYYEPEILTREFYSGYRATDGLYDPYSV